MCAIPEGGQEGTISGILYAKGYPAFDSRSFCTLRSHVGAPATAGTLWLDADPNVIAGRQLPIIRDYVHSPGERILPAADVHRILSLKPTSATGRSCCCRVRLRRPRQRDLRPVLVGSPGQ